MATDSRTAAAVKLGQEKAEAILRHRDAALKRRAAALQTHSKKLQMRVLIDSATEAVATPVIVQTAGFLVAAGDSWFDYPFFDILKLLHDGYGYNVESAAHRGDAIEDMAYEGGQLEAFARSVEKVVAQGAVPKAVLFSGGGNDIAGDEFGMLLNSAYSAIAGWNDEVVDGVLNQRVRTAYVVMLTTIARLCEERVGTKLPILTHGYDYPVPDGRGFLGGWGPLPGPWLEPGFREKFFTDLQHNVDLMRVVIDRFNVMLAELAAVPQFNYVRYIDLRQTLSTNLAGDQYKAWWSNELHPTEDGFEKVTAKFADVLSKLP